MLTKSPVKMNIQKVINKSISKKCQFDELDNSDKQKVLKFIHDNDIDCRIFTKRGFDIISQKFFVVEYMYDPFKVSTKIVELDNFSLFYQYIEKDIYTSSCYYGYVFTENEIDEYEINISKLNFQSFFEYNIKDYDLENFIQNDAEDKLIVGKNINSLKKWLVKNFDKITDINFNKIIKSFRKMTVSNYLKEADLFSLLMNRKDHDLKESLSEYIYLNSVHINKLCMSYYLKFGMNETKLLFDHLENKIIDPNVIEAIKCLILSIESGETKLSKSGEFDKCIQLYVAKVKLFYNEKEHTYVEYFFTFEELIEFLDYDLSNCDFTYAPLEVNKINQFKTSENTKFPIDYNQLTYEVTKYYKNKTFFIEQKWVNLYGDIVFKEQYSTRWFFDLTYFLENDLSYADLLNCDGFIHLLNLKNEFKTEGMKVKGFIADAFNINYSPLKLEQSRLEASEVSLKNENSSYEVLLLERQNIEDPLMNEISYVTDIHLEHRFNKNNCLSTDDANLIMDEIVDEINKKKLKTVLIGGDVANNFDLYKSFIDRFNESPYNDIFFTLGNHELWPFKGYEVKDIINIYKETLNAKNLMLVHNNLFYYRGRQWHEIPEFDLINIDYDNLRELTRYASCIIFGGIGFSGKNEKFNANHQIYRQTLNREQEIIESQNFDILYKKVITTLRDKNLIVFTHMPLKDWHDNEHYEDNIVYVSGHTHDNRYFDDEVTRVYSDNQIGYTQKNVLLKKLFIKRSFDCFSDFQDGIYQISKADYQMFYSCLNYNVNFNKSNDYIHMVKRDGTYMFFIENSKGELLLLNGGSVKKVGRYSIQYFYENLSNYAKSIKMYLNKYEKIQKIISNEIKSIGGTGKIHGSIIDIDFYNHLYLNPLDGKVIPYFAENIVDKYVYNNLPSLLKYKSPELFINYEINLKKQAGNENNLIVIKNEEISKKCIYYENTEIYSISRILKGFQYTTQSNIVRVWNDYFIEIPSEELGRQIIQDLLVPINSL